MTDKQKDLLQEIADGLRTGFADADDIREVAEAALKEVEALRGLKLGIKLAAVAGRMSKTLAEDLLVLVEAPNDEQTA